MEKNYKNVFDKKNINILLTRSMLPSDIEYIRKNLDMVMKNEYSFIIPNDYTEEELLKHVSSVDVLLGPYVSEKIVSNASDLKLVQIPWTGVENFNFDVMKNKNIPVCNTHSNADAVAEMCLALILDLIKKISYHDRKMRKGNWNREQKPLNLFSETLAQKKVCILGYGHIGEKVSELLSVFKAEVIGFNKSGSTSNKNSTSVYGINRIDEFISDADIVVIALPLTNETKLMIDSEFISKMKENVLLVNMARAAICDEDAIYQGLKEGKIGGYASDVWWNTPKRGESESFPSIKNSFCELENVVFSPHRAGFIEGSFPHLDGAIENIINLRLGNPLKNVINIENKY